MRLNTPIAPALALGVSHVIVLATHPAVAPGGLPPEPGPPGVQPEVDDVAVQLLDAALADPLVEDVHRLGAVNELVSTGGHRAKGGRDARVVPYLFLGPNSREEIGNLAAGVYSERYGGLAGSVRAVRSPDFPLLRRLVGGGEGPRGGDLLSYLFFDREFINRLVELGREQAQDMLERLPPGPDIWHEAAPGRGNGA